MTFDPSTIKETLTMNPAAKVPSGTQKRGAYGLNLAFQGDTAAAHFKALSRSLALIDSKDVPWQSEAHVNDLGLVSNMFARIYTADRGYWFSQSYAFGHPSHVISKLAAENLYRLRYGIARGDSEAVNETKAFLEREAVTDMIDTCINMGKGKMPPNEQGWAYIAWSSDDPQVIAAGASDGYMGNILSEISSQNNKNARNYGPMAAWLVNDCKAADAVIAETFAQSVYRPGFYVTNLGWAKRQIEDALISTGNLVISPWHVDDEEAYARLNLTAEEVPAAPITPTI